MTTKQWLMRARNLDNEIDSLLEIRDEERKRCLSITQSLTSDIVQTTKDPHKFDRLVEIEEIIDKQIDLCVGIKAEIIDAIMKVDNSIYRQILLLRYIRWKTFDQIADEIHYTKKQTCRFHGRALIDIGGIIGEHLQST